MAINNEALRKRASRLISEFPKGDGEPVPAIAIDATDVLSLLDQIERVELVSRMARNHDGYMAVINERDQLRAENESLSGSLERAYANYNQASFASTERGKERDQLKAEVEALRDSRRPHDAKSDTVWCACGTVDSGDATNNLLGIKLNAPAPWASLPLGGRVTVAVSRKDEW